MRHQLLGCKDDNSIGKMGEGERVIEMGRPPTDTFVREKMEACAHRIIYFLKVEHFHWSRSSLFLSFIFFLL